MANAAALGAGTDVTAVVRVNGEAVHTGTLKLADVETGLEVPEDKFEVASGLQCLESSETATILFKEGFNSAFYDMGAIVLNLRGVPDGVTVTASMMGTGEPLDPPADNTVNPAVPPPGDLAPVTLDVDSGVEVEDGVATVEISSTGMGQVVYTFNDETPRGVPDPSRRYGLRGRGMEHGGVNVLMGCRWAAARYGFRDRQLPSREHG